MLQSKLLGSLPCVQVLNELHNRGFCNGCFLLVPLFQHQASAATLHTLPKSQTSLEKTLDRLEQPGFQADPSTCASVLRICGNGTDLSDGKRLHNHILQRGLELGMFLQNLLVQMYGNCGALEDARDLFFRMHQRDAFCWNYMIKAYAQHGQGEEALLLFQTMQQEGVIPDKFIFASVLSACSTEVTVAKGRQLHACIIGSEFTIDVVVGTALVNMHGKCGSLAEAHRIFDSISERDTVCWNAMISIDAQHEQVKDVLELFDEMQREGMMPNKVTFISVLTAFASQGALTSGKEMHALVASNGLESDIIVGNALVNMYGKCGSLEDALAIFNRMPERNSSSWTSMMTAYVQQGCNNDAFQLFDQMQQEGSLHDRVAYISILSACASQAILTEGSLVHALILHSGVESDVEVGNALVNMYSKCGSLKAAQRIFDKMPKHNIVSLNAMIAAYAQHGHSQSALLLFDQIQHSALIPDQATFVSVLTACAHEPPLDVGRKLHSCIAYCEFDKDAIVGNALMSLYGKCGYLEDARMVFDKLLDRDDISWSAMIALDSSWNEGKYAFDFFAQMQQEGVMPSKVVIVSLLSACASRSSLDEGKRMHARLAGSELASDVVMGNALINMYEKCGSIDHACRIFEIIADQDAVSWTAMIVGYTNMGQCRVPLVLFDKMQQGGLIADRVTFICIISACASQGALAKGKQIHACIISSVLESDVVVGNALINMYGKCGSLNEAHNVFDKMPVCDVVSWTSMIAIYAQHGKGKDALQLFNQMWHEGVLPDKVTFISVLCACSHAGLVDEGCYWFLSMKRDLGIAHTIDHFNSMVDLLGRAGRLDEAEKVIMDMPFQASIVSWMTLLGACRYQVDVERGERAASHVFRLNPLDPTPYVVLSSVYAAAGREDDAARMINLMKEKSLKQQTCCDTPTKEGD